MLHFSQLIKLKLLIDYYLKILEIKLFMLIVLIYYLGQISIIRFLLIIHSFIILFHSLE
jgi:hypothetical protein